MRYLLVIAGILGLGVSVFVGKRRQGSHSSACCGWPSVWLPATSLPPSRGGLKNPDHTPTTSNK
jgi:hypothetical protein